jgi:hypothetical protein
LDSIEYKGKRITFDREYLSSLVSAFKQKACGAVPFQLADGDNKHTNDPLRRYGTVTDLELVADGLDAIVELDDDGEALVKKYKDLGVSARIYENYDRSDGRFFKAAVQHVLGTLDPHIVGMRPWQSVSLSQEEEVSDSIDLSDQEFEERKEDEKPVATKATLKETLAKLREKGDEAELTDDELDQLLAITDAMADDKVPASDAPDKKDEVEQDDDLSDEEIDKLIATAEAEAAKLAVEDKSEAAPEKDERQLVAAAQDREAIELASAQLEQQRIELAGVKSELAQQRYEAEQRTFAQQYGIPPYITELARPLLEGDGHVVELANGEEQDAGAIMRKVLIELGSQIKVLDLGGLIGSSIEEPTDDEVKAQKAQVEETKQFLEQVKGSYSF